MSRVPPFILALVIVTGIVAVYGNENVVPNAERRAYSAGYAAAVDSVRAHPCEVCARGWPTRTLDALGVQYVVMIPDSTKRRATMRVRFLAKSVEVGR